MATIWSSRARTDRWLEVEIAACVAWAELGTVPRDAVEKIRGASYSLEEMAVFEAETQHDVTAFLRSVQKSLGPEGRYVHYGLTSSDVVDTGLALQIVAACDVLDAELARLLTTLERLAVRHRDTLAIGRTHGVHAEPTSFGFRVAMWVDEFRRQRQRLAQAREQIAVGKISGAVGTHATVPPEVEERVCRALGLTPANVSTQIIQRDRHAHVLTTIALLGSSIEKVATEIRSLQRTEIREVEEPFGEGQTGSSSMPHKRNPVLTERLSGLARLLRGYAITAMENVALWHERDISHSSTERITFPSGFTLAHYMVVILRQVLDGLQVYPDRMRANVDLTRGLVYSQRVLNTLIEKGLDRQTAYKAVQSNAMRVWAGDGDFQSLLGADETVSSTLTPDELAAIFDPQYYLRHVGVAFDRLGLSS